MNAGVGGSYCTNAIVHRATIPQHLKKQGKLNTEIRNKYNV